MTRISESQRPRRRYLPAVVIISALLSILLFIGIGASAPERSKLVANPMYPAWETDDKKARPVPFIEKVRNEAPVERSLRLKKMKLGVGDIKTPTVSLNGSTLVSDVYKPAKFMMKDHALREKLDCGTCHHKAPDQAYATEAEARSMETIRCEKCHQGSAIVTTTDDHLSLKAAYHQRCISCHKEKGGEKAPVYCTGCHRRNIPDHEKVFTTIGDAEEITPTQVTGLCLDCHPRAGEEMLLSAHYNWGGPLSKWTVTKEFQTVTGKEINAVNNNCISPYGDWRHCTKCHVGYQAKEELSGFSDDPKNIDCLVCHAAEDTYGKGKNGMPDEDTDLVWAIGYVGATSRASCGACHFKAGGGNARKGTLYNALNHPERETDVHMGGEFKMICADCHKGRQHRIPGRHSSIGVDEGIVECTDCHATRPHGGNDLAKHLDRHVDHIQCGTCHIPEFAREQQTRDFWDWRDVGKRGAETLKNEGGKPVYLPDEGTFRWKQNIIPHYSWDNGYTRRYIVGDKIDDFEKPVIIGRNLGDYADSDSRIAPFKIFQGWQPADTVNRYLALPKLTGEEGVWESKEWERAIELGMKDAGLPYSGEMTFVQTELRFRPRHEVAPKAAALTCVQCHSLTLADERRAEDTCKRCHNKNKPEEIGDILARGKGLKGEYLSWVALGYAEDPIINGGRFSD